MGIRLSIGRFPADPAVDLLTLRRRFEYVEFERPELDTPSYLIWDPVPDEHKPARWLDFDRAHALTFEAMTGMSRGSILTEDGIERSRYFGTEYEDPRAWVVYGKRSTGWPTPDFPLKYALPEDVPAICEALAATAEADLRRGVERAHEERKTSLAQGGEVSYPAEIAPMEIPTLEELLDLFQERYLPFFPAIRRFYEAAREAGEFVVYWMH